MNWLYGSVWVVSVGRLVWNCMFLRIVVYLLVMIIVVVVCNLVVLGNMGLLVGSWVLL